MDQNNISRLPLREIRYKSGIIEDDFFAKLKADSLYYIPNKTWESLFLFCKDSQEIFLLQIDSTYSNGEENLNEVRLYYYAHKEHKNQSDVEFWDGFIFDKAGVKQRYKKTQGQAARAYEEFLQKLKSNSIIDETSASEIFVKKMDNHIDIEKTKNEIKASINKGNKESIKTIKL